MNPHVLKSPGVVVLAALLTLLTAPALGPDLVPGLPSALGGELLAQPRASLVHGAEIRVLQRPEGELRGELLALEPDRLWLLSGDTEVRSALRSDIRRVDMERHGLGSRRLLTWTVLAGGITGAAMASACRSVNDRDGGCGGFTLGWIAMWAGLGGLSLAAAQPTRRVEPHALEELRPWARFPQGLPADFLPAYEEND